jgi:hypothetical protein
MLITAGVRAKIRSGGSSTIRSCSVPRELRVNRSTKGVVCTYRRRMKMLALMALLMGCTTTDAESSHVRWPKHRQMHDERLDKLEAELVVLRHHVTELEIAVKALPATTTSTTPNAIP